MDERFGKNIYFSNVTDVGVKEGVQFSEPQKADFYISFSRQVSQQSISDSSQLKCPVYVYNCSLDNLKDQLVHPNSTRQPRDIFFRYYNHLQGYKGKCKGKVQILKELNFSRYRTDIFVYYWKFPSSWHQMSGPNCDFTFAIRICHQYFEVNSIFFSLFCFFEILILFIMSIFITFFEIWKNSDIAWLSAWSLNSKMLYWMITASGS